MKFFKSEEDLAIKKLEVLIETIERQNSILNAILYNSGVCVEALNDLNGVETIDTETYDTVIKTEDLGKLLDTGYISPIYAKKPILDGIESNSFYTFLRESGLTTFGEYLSQIKKLYIFCCERGLTEINEDVLYDFQHEYGNYKHSVRHSTINYFKEYLYQKEFDFSYSIPVPMV